MTQVSRYPLDKEIENEVYKKFWGSMSTLRLTEDVSAFFSDFLTDTEELMLAKRFTIAVLLLRGRRPKEIKDILHVSNSATGAVGAWLKNAQPKTMAILERVIRENNWESFLDKIDSFLESLPPNYASNWKRVGRERRERRMSRVLRSTIR